MLCKPTPWRSGAVENWHRHVCQHAVSAFSSKPDILAALHQIVCSLLHHWRQAISEPHKSNCGHDIARVCMLVS